MGANFVKENENEESSSKENLEFEDAIKGPFKMGWSIVMFDLPVATKKERKIATDFRKFLLKDGYSMMQYSVYMRYCMDYERMKKHAKRLKQSAPPGGNIRAIFITDIQWEKSIAVIGEDYSKSRGHSLPEKQELFQFW